MSGLPESMRTLIVLILIPLLLSMSITVPKMPKVKKYYIVSPRISVPAFVEGGDSFKLVLKKSYTVEKVVISNGVYEYECPFEGSGREYVVKVPKEVKRGVYDLIVYTKRYVLAEPRAVVVDFPKNLIIFHVTDRHFGVVNSNGRSAFSYDLAAILLAQSSIANIIIDTGDLADTAKISEYRDSLLVDTLSIKPIVGIPGNHDNVNIRNYERYRGPTNFVIKTKNFIILGLNTGANGYITERQGEMAKEILEEAKQPVKIVLFHHPLFAFTYNRLYMFKVTSAEDLYKILVSKKPGSRWPFIYTSWLDNKEGLMNLLEGLVETKGLVVTLSGHIHLDSYAQVEKPNGEIYFITTTTTGGSVRPGDYRGFKIIEVRDGTVKVIGKGKPWDRHASFSLERVKAYYVKTRKAVTVALDIEDPEVLKVMRNVTLVVPIPWYGKLGVDGNVTKAQLRCTPASCVLVVLASEKPSLGFYRVTVYKAPDLKPPTVKVSYWNPQKGKPLTVWLRFYDDAWGVLKVEAELVYGGKTMKLSIAKVSSTRGYLVIPPLDVDKAELVIKVTDASGKVTVKRVTINFT